MAAVRLDIKTETAYQWLQAFVGVVDSGGKQLSTDTGRKLTEILKERSGARRGLTL